MTSDDASSRSPDAPHSELAWFTVNELQFDLENPRMGREADDQSEALELLMAAAGDTVVTLAADIWAEETLNPGDLPFVVVEDGVPVLVEGNRRLAALKLLHDPTLAPAYAARLERITATLGSAPDRVRCAVFPTREASAHWVRIRHLGEQGGRGVRRWSTADQHRYDERDGGTPGIHTALLRWVDDNYADDPQMLALSDKVRQGSLTTLKRVLYVVVRRRLGISVRHGRLHAGHTPDALRPILAAILEGAAAKRKGRSTWSRMSQDEMLKWLDQREDLLPPDVEQLPDIPTQPARHAATQEAAPLTAAEQVPEQPAPAAQPAPRPPETPTEAVVLEDSATVPVATADENPIGPAPSVPPLELPSADRLFNQDELDVFKSFDQPLYELAAQANSLSIPRQTRIAGVALRVIVDVCVREFLRRHGKEQGANTHLWKNVQAAIRIIDPDIEQHDTPLRATFRAFDQSSRGTLALTMNDWVHQLGGHAAPSEVKAAATVCWPLVVAAAKNLGQTG